MKRKALSLIVSSILVFSCSLSVLANEDITTNKNETLTVTMPIDENFEHSNSEIITMPINENIENMASLENVNDISKNDTDANLDFVDGKVVVPTKADLVEKLLKHYNKNPEKQQENIKNVESIAEEIISFFTHVDSNEVTTQDIRVYPHSHYWSQSPKVTNHYHSISYATSWAGIDCYRSSTGGTKSAAEAITITTTLGFTGSAKVKEFLTLGGSWSYTHTTTYTVTAGTSCPAWTVQWWRPYCRYEVTEYAGSYVTEYYNLQGQLVADSQGEYATDKVLKDDMTEFADKVNTAKDVNATTPSAPTGVPNAWW